MTAPGLMRRMACGVYESLLMFGMLLIPGAIGALFFAMTGHPQPLLGAFTLLLFAVYFSWFWSARGQTLPMQTWSIRVETVGGRPLSRGRALARFVAACAWLAPAAVVTTLNHWTPRQDLAAYGIGIVAYALLALLHPQRQFWHDALCGTRLVDAPREPARREADNPAA